MNTLVLPNHANRSRKLRVVEFATEFVAGLRDGLRVARRYQALNSLSDAELARRGLSRADIARAAVQAIG